MLIIGAAGAASHSGTEGRHPLEMPWLPETSERATSNQERLYQEVDAGGHWQVLGEECGLR